MKPILAAGVALSLLQSLSVSAAQVTDSLSITGFFSLDATYTDNPGANIPRPQGKGSDLDADEVSFDSSVYGVRADLDIFEGLGAGLQVIGTKQTGTSFDPEIEWAYLKYDFSNDISIRAGQLKLPFLQGTELRYVGNSRLWARPVVPANGAGGFDDFRGAELYYNTYAGDYDIQLHASYGEPEHGNDFIKNTQVGLVSAELDSGNAKVRLAVLNAVFDVYSNDNGLLDKSANMLMGSLEGEYQRGDWVANAGLVSGQADSHPDEDMAYFSLGYRFDRFTPYVLYYRKVMDFTSLTSGGDSGSADRGLLGSASESPSGSLPEPSPDSTPEPPPDPVPEPPSDIEESEDGDRVENAIALGFRYDLTPRLSVKLQWDYQKEHDNAYSSRPEKIKESNIYTIVFEGVF